MSGDAWHVDPPLWQAYVGGQLDEVAEASVEAHVGRCPGCRSAAVGYVAPSEVESLWRGVSTEVGRPVLPRSVRWLRRLGAREDDLVLVAASDGLVLPWSLALAGALACALVTGLLPRQQDAVFLLLAPLVPVAAVLAALEATDPLRTLAATTPYSGLRLALLRTSATLAVALPVTLAVGLAVPGLEPLAGAWLLPALALTSTTLALMTWLSPVGAAGAAAAGWSAVVLATARIDDVTVLAGLAAQLGLVGVLLAGAALVALRTTTYRIAGGRP